MSNYRVFISYSHEDRELVDKIVSLLENIGLCPMWDRDFAYGSGFHDQIKTFIAQAHVFLPVITEASSRRGWVHQEIGYAMALNVPVLPLATGVLPGEMIQGLQAVQFDGNIEQLQDLLTEEVFYNLVNQYSETKYALHQCADLTEDRAMMMTEYAERVLALRSFVCVRQKGALSSFNIPDKVIHHQVWKQRYGDVNRGPFHCRVQRGERRALEKHARVAGCRLIIDPSISYDLFGIEARIVRLKTLLEFLESMPNDKVQVAINDRMNIEESVTIVGDWFHAQSVSSTMGHGYRQTIFTCHAPSMQMKIELFDQEFEELLQTLGWNAASSKNEAISLIKNLINDLTNI
jgi:hypothetical protein